MKETLTYKDYNKFVGLFSKAFIASNCTLAQININIYSVGDFLMKIK